MPSFDHSKSVIYLSKVFHIISSSFGPSFCHMTYDNTSPSFSDTVGISLCGNTLKLRCLKEY